MKWQIPESKPDPNRQWHRWFAWHPVVAQEPGRYTNYSTGAEFVVWLQPVMRRKMSNTELTWWLYELIPALTKEGL